jgi:hypothetical protein
MIDDAFTDPADDPVPGELQEVPGKPPGGPLAASTAVEGIQTMPRVLARALQALGSIPPAPSKGLILARLLREPGRERLH